MKKFMCEEDKKKMMEFGVRIATHSILKQLNKDGGHHKNLVLSPLSLHICLNMLTAGAKGPTLDQLLRFLNAEDLAQLNAHSSRFMELASPEPEPDSPPGSPMDEDPRPEPELNLLNGSPRDESTDRQLNDQPSLFATKPNSPLFENPSRGTSLNLLTNSPFSGNPIRGPFLFGQPFDNSPFSGHSRFHQPFDNSPLSGNPSQGPFLFGQPFDNSPLSGNPSRGPSLFGQPFDNLPFSGNPSPGPALFGNPGPGPYPLAAKPITTKSDSAFKSRSRGKGPIISMVNGIWVGKCFSLKHSFKLMADEVYKAECESVNFNKAEEVEREINAWAKKASKGLIDDVVSSDTLKNAVLLIANALYFKGSWFYTFEPSNTKEEDFCLLDGKRVRVPFMKQWCTSSYYQSMNGFQLLKMDYKRGEDKTDYAMYIFLPDRHDELPELIEKFHSDPGFFTQNHQLENVQLDKLWLPKLKFDYRFDVAENIKELGLDLPFDGVKAELKEIVNEDDLYVSNVIQKSYIELNEEGTVAASVTYATCCTFGAPMAMRAPPSIDFVADHPFLFMIKEAFSGSVLFVGAALNPLD